VSSDAHRLDVAGTLITNCLPGLSVKQFSKSVNI